MGQMVEIQIGKSNYPEGELDKKNNRQKIPRTETQPVQDGYLVGGINEHKKTYPVRQINRKEDLQDTPTPSSSLQIFDAYMKTGKLGKKGLLERFDAFQNRQDCKERFLWRIAQRVSVGM